MNLISLNAWSGKAGKEKILVFFERHKKDTDIFCLQEIWHNGPDLTGHKAGGNLMRGEIRNIFDEISRVLNTHKGYFRPHFKDWFGLATFVRKNIDVFEEGDRFVHKHRVYEPENDIANHARNIQYIKIRFPDGLRTIINFHGLWNGGGKGDSEERLAQSKKILEFIKELSEPFLITGDFNLAPTAESLIMLEKFGLRNLIKEYGINQPGQVFIQSR